MDDIIESIGAIYKAIGDVERWRQLNERLAMARDPSSEIQHHLEIARQAHEMHVTLLEGIETLASVHNQLALAAVIVDRDRQMLRANAAATRLLAGNNGLTLVGDRVEATDANNQAVLHSAIERASTAACDANAADGPFILMRRPYGPPLSVVVLRARQPLLRFCEDRLPVLLLIFDPVLVTAPDPHVLRALFSFTEREAQFAALLMQGLTVEDAAHGLGVTLSTARTFLARVRQKTDSPNQAELVRQLMAVPSIDSRPRHERG